MITRRAAKLGLMGCGLMLLLSGVCLYNAVFIFFFGDCPGVSDDLFYKCAGELEFVRFPLIAPYEAINYGHVRHKIEYQWIVDLQHRPIAVDHSSIGYLHINHLQLLSIEKGAILLYAPESTPMVVGDTDDYDWFVLIPEQNIEMGFNHEEDFLQYIQTLDIQRINWFKPDDIFQQFYQTGDLSWIPEETKSWLYLFSD